MKMVPVSSQPTCRLKCIACEKSFFTDEEDMYADADGVPFEDYYCSPCTIVVESEYLYQQDQVARHREWLETDSLEYDE